MSATATGAGTADTSTSQASTTATTPPAAGQPPAGTPPATPPATAPAGTGLVIPETPPVTLPSDALLAGKFKTPADLATGYANLADKLGLKGVVRDTFEKPEDQVAAYKALEARLGAQAPAKPAAPALTDPPAKPTETGIGQPPAEAPKTIADVLARANLSQDDIAATFTKDGKLTAEQYAALEKVAPGFLSPEMVDQFIGAHIANLQQMAARAQANAIQLAGGEKQLQTLLAYADSLPKAVKDDLNARLGKTDLYEGALLEIQSRYMVAARAGGSQTLVGGTMGATGSSLYASQDEVNQDMRDPKYNHDANFRAAVQTRLYRSVQAGTVKLAGN